MSIAVVKRYGSRANVCLGAAVNLFGLVEWLTALPELHYKRISGPGHGTGPPVSRHQQGVSVNPHYVLFRAGKHEAALDELACIQIELAQGVCILTPCGEPHETQFVSRIETDAALLNPFLVVLLSQRVVVQQRLP